MRIWPLEGLVPWTIWWYCSSIQEWSIVLCNNKRKTMFNFPHHLSTHLLTLTLIPGLDAQMLYKCSGYRDWDETLDNLQLKQTLPVGRYPSVSYPTPSCGMFGLLSASSEHVFCVAKISPLLPKSTAFLFELFLSSKQRDWCFCSPVFPLQIDWAKMI